MFMVIYGNDHRISYIYLGGAGPRDLEDGPADRSERKAATVSARSNRVI